MTFEVLMGGPEEDTENKATDGSTNPDQFFANSAFRMIYQTNNFFLPQIRDLIDRGEVLNLRKDDGEDRNIRDVFAGLVRKNQDLSNHSY